MRSSPPRPLPRTASPSSFGSPTRPDCPRSCSSLAAGPAVDRASGDRSSGCSDRRRPLRSSRSLRGTAVRDEAAAVRTQVARQVAHWRAAIVTLDDLDNFAAPSAWHGLERQLGTTLRRHLRTAVDRLQREADVLEAQLRAADTAEELEGVRRAVVRFRRRFLATATALDFYGDAVNSRTNPKLAALLAACDVLARRSLESVLTPLGKPVPPILTYIDKGLGASILR